MKIFLETNVLWSTNYELSEKKIFDHVAAQFSGVPPIHNHQGQLKLTENNLIIEGDVNLTVSLSDVDQIYRGFDEYYRPNFIKNLGLFCQPVRIKYSEKYIPYTIYLIAGYNFFGCTKSRALFEALQEVLS